MKGHFFNAFFCRRLVFAEIRDVNRLGLLIYEGWKMSKMKLYLIF
jgi:hypothetical protein